MVKLLIPSPSPSPLLPHRPHLLTPAPLPLPHQTHPLTLTLSSSPSPHHHSPPPPFPLTYPLTPTMSTLTTILPITIILDASLQWPSLLKPPSLLFLLFQSHWCELNLVTLYSGWVSGAWGYWSACAHPNQETQPCSSERNPAYLQAEELYAWSEKEAVQYTGSPREPLQD